MAQVAHNRHCVEILARLLNGLSDEKAKAGMIRRMTRAYGQTLAEAVEKRGQALQGAVTCPTGGANDNSQAANEVAAFFRAQSHWAEHAEFSSCDWQRATAACETRLGYADWCIDQARNRERKRQQSVDKH